MSIKLPILYLLLCLLTRQVLAEHATNPASSTAQLSFPAPEISLHSLPSEAHTTLTHEQFPNHALRIRQTTGWCDPGVRSWTGYLDVGGGAKHLFFYFFESRTSPADDPLLMWINGGPGCSSSLGLFMELGPCTVSSSANHTIPRPQAWNVRANVFFLDQPVGVGFSYAGFGERVESTEEAARDVVAFLGLFVQTFGEFGGREVHMAGESYAGHYLPVFASAVVDQNKRLVANDLENIDLKSVMIENGDTGYVEMFPTIYDIVCTNASLPPILDISQCVRMKRAVPRCTQMVQTSCIDILDELACTAAMSFCSAELEEPILRSGKNPYDISKDCEGSLDDTLCYPVMARIGEYLNLNSTRAILGVDERVERFETCSPEVGAGFRKKLDQNTPILPYITALLERNVSVLIYVGTHDPICNWLGNLRWTEELEWRGHGAYKDERLRPWMVGEDRIGLTKGGAGLTFATIEGAGHMVPYDKPEVALAMLNRWLERREL